MGEVWWRHLSTSSKSMQIDTSSEFIKNSSSFLFVCSKIPVIYHQYHWKAMTSRQYQDVPGHHTHRCALDHQKDPFNANYGNNHSKYSKWLQCQGTDILHLLSVSGAPGWKKNGNWEVQGLQLLEVSAIYKIYKSLRDELQIATTYVT